MELSPYYINHGMLGEADGLVAPHTAQLYLLDKTGRIVSEHTKGVESVIGKYFFEVYPANAAERDAFRQALGGFESRNLLLVTRSSPALLCCGAFGKSGMALCALPTDEVRRTLLYPGDFAGVLPQLMLSPTAATRRRAHDAAAFLAASRWYTPFERAFCSTVGDGLHALTNALSTRVTYLALLCGVRVEFDFRNAVLLCNTQVDIDLYTGVIMAVLMAARRLDATSTVQMYLDRNDRDGAVLHVRFSAPDERDTIPELEAIDLAALMRGMAFHPARYIDNPGEVHLYASLTLPELSVQGTKQENPLLRWPSQLDYAPRSIPIERPDTDQ